MRRLLGLVCLLSITACKVGNEASLDELPESGEYSWEHVTVQLDGTLDKAGSGSRFESFSGGGDFAERILNPANNCHDVDASVTNGTIEIKATCRLMGVEVPSTFTGKYGRDFWHYRVAMQGPAGEIVEDHRHDKID